MDKKKYDIVNILFLTLTPIIAFVLVFLHLKLEGFLWQQWLFGVFFYFAVGLSITAGYHRLFSHRAYKTTPLVESLLLFFGAGAFQNSLLKWATDHRRHHTKCDSDEDPYSISKGFFYAHMGWIFEAEGEDLSPRLSRDLLRNPRVMFQHRYYLLLSVLSGFVVPTLIGWMLGSWLGGLAIAGFLRIVVVHHATFLINSLCHVWGTQPYGDDNSAKDSYLMAFFTYGEGYHNYHHHFQADYRNGVRWFDFDPSKWLIATLAFFGKAWDLIKTEEEDILAAKLQMQHKRACQNALNPGLKIQIEDRFLELKAQLRELKKRRKEMMAAREDKALELWEELKQALNNERELFNKKLTQWQRLVSANVQSLPL